MNDYQRWNQELATHFFNPEMAGRNVNLYVNQDLIDKMQQAMPEVRPFQATVAGPPTDQSYCERVCRRAYQAFGKWRDLDLSHPPYIAYLCFFVLAVDLDESDFAPHAYYPRLWKLAGMNERRDGRPPFFEHMRELWEDLEDWSVHDCQGERGIFQARSRGGYVHVGYPLSQALLVEQERRDLPRIFEVAGFNPATDYPTDELARALRSPIAKQRLRKKTLRLLETRSDESLYHAVLDVVAEELAVWNGTVTSPAPGQNLASLIVAGLRICIDLDRMAGTAETYVRCKFNHEFPENGLVLDDELEAEEWGNGWSLPIQNRDTGEILNAAQLDWTRKKTMHARPNGWELRLPGQEVRIFASGAAEGLSGLVECYSIPMGQPFYLSCSEQAWPRLEQWATTQCQGFQEIAIEQGLPRGWRLAECQKAASGLSVKDEFAPVAFRSRTRLRLVGGIRSGSGNSRSFFHFAPPGVALSGAAPGMQVYCDDLPLPPATHPDIYKLPGNLAIETKIVIEAKDSQQQVLDQVSLFLTGDFSVVNRESEIVLDAAGASTPSRNDEPSVFGAYVTGYALELTAVPADLFADWEAEMGGIQGFLIGCLPGQIAAWPAEPFPSQWVPSWAIKKQGRKLTAIFIADALGAPETGTTAEAPTPRAVQEWKKLLWHRRKRIAPPVPATVRPLWQQLQARARDVR